VGGGGSAGLTGSVGCTGSCALSGPVGSVGSVGSVELVTGVVGGPLLSEPPQAAARAANDTPRSTRGGLIVLMIESPALSRAG
jgi:hypothetical protein